MSSDLNPLDLPTDLPLLPDGWSWTALSRLVDPNRGICYGIVQPGKHHFDGIPMVNTGDVLDGRVNLEIGFRVEKKLHDQFRRSTLRGGELLVTLVGANFGRVAIAPPEFAGHNCSRAVGVVPLKGNTEFVMFALRSPVARHFFDTWANTTAQPTFNLKDLGKLPVPVPPVESAKQISNMLMALDDRITLLRETNATLEAIAQALFKSWFVDFDPVRAKAEGLEPQAMDAPTAVLFPDSFEESELGLLPTGWRVGVLSDCCERVESGGTPRRTAPEYWGGEVPWLTSGEVRKPIVLNTKEKITELGVNQSSAKIWPQGTTVVAMYGATAGEVCLLANPSTANQACCGLIPLVYSRAFTFICARRERAALASKSSGSAQQNLNKGLVSNHPVLLPPKEVLSVFENVAGAALDGWIANEKQTQTLTQLRDTLLPRLISGQLRLPAAEALLEGAL